MQELEVAAGGRTEYGYGGMELWDKRTLAQQLGSERYVGGLLIRAPAICTRSITRWAWRAPPGRRVTIYEQSPVLRLEQGMRPVVHAEHGQVRCEHVVLACNAYIGQLLPQLERKIMPAGTYVIATEPWA
jgi:gamma-glutamylputrescine oxidase